MVRLKEEGGVAAKIIDLGLAKTPDESASEAGISSPGAFVGTPEFASPEQFIGVGVDIRSDLYSLGVTLWVMVTGQAPFHGSTAEVMDQHQHAPLPLEQLKGAPQPVIALLEVLLKKDPARRFRNPTDLLNALPKVTDALQAGRTINHQALRDISDQRLGASGKTIEVVTNNREAMAARSVRLILWLALLLVIGGGAIFALNSLFVYKAPPRHVSSSFSAGVTAQEKSIAILPFESLSENQNDSYFADGVQDEILANIARISQLRVVSRTSVMRYRPNAQRDLRQIASALGVVNILEGTVRRASNRVRITVELIDARSDRAIWSEIYDRDQTDIFTIQSEVAESIARKLTATLSPEEKKRIEAKPTDNLEAYDLYLRAKELISPSGVFVAMESDRPLRDAISLLDHAVRLDPEFTLAYCAAAQTHSLLYFHDPSPEQRALGGAAIANALRLQPDLPEVRLAYAFYLYFCYDYPDYGRIREQLAIAKPGLSNSAEVFRLEAWMDRRLGKWEKAVQELNEAIARDPGNIPSLYDLSDTTGSLRQWSVCRKLNDRLIELVPDRLIPRLGKGIISVQERGDDGPLRSAIAALPGSMAEDPSVLTYRLCIALTDRDWRQVKEIIEKFKGGEDSGQFAYGTRPVPIGCYSILIARLQGESAGANPKFAETRQQLNQKVQKSPENALLLSQLAVVDALLDNKETAVSEAKRAAETLPVSKDAVDGTAILMNLVLVYVWTSELDRAFEILVPLTKMPAGFCYGQFKLDPYWDPVRKNPRFEKLVADLAPKD